jgi:tRNA (guanine-N7-)-methyltransferase
VGALMDELTSAAPEQQPERRRAIRSFVLRQGRMTPGQQRAFDEQWPRWGLRREDGPLDQPGVFGRQAPLVLEIGFGMGQSLVAQAQAEPERDFIGIEVHRPGVGKLLHTMAEQGVTNIRAYNDDAVEVLNQCIVDDSLDLVQIYFPDPWHKKKHNKRRLVQPAFVQLLRRKLRAGGVLHLATDWQDYAEQMLAVMSAADGFVNQAGDGYAPRPERRPLTKFEQRGHRLGHGVWDLLFEKRG